jgi:hypothetical protein
MRAKAASAFSMPFLCSRLSATSWAKVPPRNKRTRPPCCRCGEAGYGVGLGYPHGKTLGCLKLLSVTGDRSGMGRTAGKSYESHTVRLDITGGLAAVFGAI